MLFLSGSEREQWQMLAKKIRDHVTNHESILTLIRPNLKAAFCFHIGVLLTADGERERGERWLKTGTLMEADGLFSNAFLLGFLKRQEGKLIIPSPAFEDPRYFIHFASVPVMQRSRARFLDHLSHTLPIYDHQIRLMDIGCGDGSLTTRMLTRIASSNKTPGVSEVLLIDPSPAMLDLAEQTVRRAHPDVKILTANTRIQDLTSHLDHRFEIAVSSLAYHHMPYEEKACHLTRLKPWIDHFILFEMDANNDAPELHSPELSFSVYQSYGRIIDFVFSHDAEVEIAVSCVDRFLMSEMVSLLTEERGMRSDYHMLRTEWHQLFRDVLVPDFSLRSDSNTYSDEHVGLFTLHYGRE